MRNRKNTLKKQLNSLAIKDQSLKELLLNARTFEIVERVQHSFKINKKTFENLFALIRFNSKYLILHNGYGTSISGNFHDIYNTFWKTITNYSAKLSWEKSKSVPNFQPCTKSNSVEPTVFICHDSRDKLSIASIIADGLRSMGCEVIYDEYTFFIGTQLRETTEKDIVRSDKFIVIITPNFLINQGWTKTEVDIAFTRELHERKHFILPVWFGVSKEDVYLYSPILFNKLGVNWEDGVTVVLEKLYKVITE